MIRGCFVDLDGTLADFDRFYNDCFGVELNRYGEEPNDMWQRISAHGSFYRDLPLMTGALSMWQVIRQIHFNPIILTGVSDKLPEAEGQKREWVKRWLGPQVKVICCRSKEKYLHGKPGDVLIDDWTKYQHLWENMGGVFIHHKTVTETLAALHALNWYPDEIPNSDQKAQRENDRAVEPGGFSGSHSGAVELQQREPRLYDSEADRSSASVGNNEGTRDSIDQASPQDFSSGDAGG